MSGSIAIDGPAGAGKSTIARIVAKELGFIYVDTGAMYRAMALYMLRAGVDASDGAQVEARCKEADITLRYEDGGQVVLLNGENVNGLIRKEEVGGMASEISTNAALRAHLVSLQQRLAEKESVVMDGRDIGTVVLPQAKLKIYLTASAEVRAQRRYKELLEKGRTDADPAQIQKDIEERDRRDMTRAASPLKKAEDAVEVDTSDMTIEEVAARILALYGERPA